MPLRPNPNKPITAAEVRRLVNDAVRRSLGAQGLRTHHIGGQLNIEGPGHPIIPNTAVHTFQITAIQDDYLECVYYDLTNDIASTRYAAVAKPWMLRVTPFDFGGSITYENGDVTTYNYTNRYMRTATTAGDDVTEYITPGYFIDDTIRAIKTITGVTDGSGRRVPFEDVNAAGRQWQQDIGASAGAGFYVVNVVADLPAVDAPAMGYVLGGTEAETYWKHIGNSITGEWIRWAGWV